MSKVIWPVLVVVFALTAGAFAGEKTAVPLKELQAQADNFLFGWASNLGGIMSYRRFTAEFNNDIPNQDRLVKRTLMQCLSSVGIIYGVKRCTNPACARAYPNSLPEHEAKTGTLCPECRDGFKAVFE